MSDIPRVYIASLSDYNAGVLHGQWFDLTEYESGEELYEDVKDRVIATSRQPFAEEWAIHDYEGFGEYRIAEYESLDAVVDLANALEEHGGAFVAWLANDTSRTPDDIENFHEQFKGEWPSEKAYTEEFLSECGWGTLTPEIIDENFSYIDIDHIKHEMFDVGDYWSAPTPDYNVWVFCSY